MLSVSDYWFCLYFLLKFSKKLGHKSIVIVLFTTTVLFIILRKFCMQLKNTFSLKLCHHRAWLSCILASLNFTLRKALKQMLSAGSSIDYFFKDENINRYLLFSIAKEYISFFFCIFKEEKQTIKSNILHHPFVSTYAKCHSSALRAYFYFLICASTYH